MKNLSQTSGLPIQIENTGLEYDKNEFAVEPKVRTYDEAKDVYLEKGAVQQDLYRMYRYFERAADKEKFETANLEYDLTVIKSGKIGPELVKTIGHYHSSVPGSELTYPEVYEVIDGEVEYLLQTKPDSESRVDVVIIRAKQGDKVVIPPGYGHVSVNVGADSLVSSNVQFRDLPATADYETFASRNGGALYRTESGWQKSLNYNIVSQKIVTPKQKPEWGLTHTKPLYTSFIESPEKFKWLTEPEDFDFSDVWIEI